MIRFTTLLTVFFCVFLFAKDLRFDHITARDGLSQASVTCITQDSMGFIWLGTYNGLNRYDGYNFRIFRNDPDDDLSISNNFIRSVLIDSRNLLWIGTHGGGLNIFDFEKENFIRIDHDREAEYSEGNDQIYAVYEDKDGTIWVATWGGGLFKIVLPENYNSLTSDFRQHLKIQQFKQNPDNPLTFTSNKITDITQDQNGLLWLTTRYGVTLFDPQTERVVKTYTHDPGDPFSLSNNNVSAIEIVRDNTIWIASWNGGLNKYDAQRDGFIHFQKNPQEINCISSNTLLSLFADKAGHLWIGTWGGGLNILREYNEQIFIKAFKHNPDDKRSVNGNYIYNMFQDKSGVIWVGTDLNGISKYNPDSEKFRSVNLQQYTDLTLNDNIVSAILKDSKGILWIGTRSDGLLRVNPNNGQTRQFTHNPDNHFTISNNTVRVIKEDKYGNLWLGTELGLNYFNRTNERFLVYFSNPDDRSESNIFNIYEDKKGNYWIANWGGGLNKFNPETKTFRTFKNNPDDPGSISENIVWSITQDKKGLIWIGTENGLNVFDTITQTFKVFRKNKNEPTSLLDNKILSLLSSPNGNLYIGSPSGLNILKDDYDISGMLSFEQVTRDNGLYGNSVQGLLEDAQGNLWLSNGDYLTKLNLLTMETEGYNGYTVLQIGEINVNSLFKDPVSGEMYFGGNNGYTHFHPDSIKKNPYLPNVVITDFKIFNKSIHVGDTLQSGFFLDRSLNHIKRIELSYLEDNISIEIASLGFNASENNHYKYRLLPYEKNWNLRNADGRTVVYSNLEPGQYKFQFNASNHDDVWNPEAQYLDIIITPPYWETWWFRTLLVLAVIFVFTAYYRFKTKSIKDQNLVLEGAVKDKTLEMENLMEKMVRQEKLAAVGQVAGSIAHELRNPLSAALQSNYYLRSKLTDMPPKIQKHLNIVDEEISIAGKVIDDLMKISKVDNSQKDYLNLKSLVIDAINRSKLPSDIKTEINIDDSGPPVMADYNQLRQVFVNLFINARQAMDQGGLISVSGRLSDNKDYVEITILDSGHGIDNEAIDKIFEPLFSTKTHGTGLGLSICKQIIEKHGGHIYVTSERNKGTTFLIVLPLVSTVFDTATQI